MDFSLISNIAEGAQIAGVGLAIYGARRAYKQWQREKKWSVIIKCARS